MKRIKEWPDPPPITYTSCDFGMNYIQARRISIVARGIERCMKSLNIPLKVVGTIIPKKEKTDYFDIRFETEDQIYWASAFCMSLDYFLEDYQNEDEIRILTTSKGASNFAITDSGLDLIAHSMEKTLKEFYNFVKKSGQIDMAPFEGLKNITVTARRYFNIKHHSHKYRLMFEFNTKD